MSWIKDAFIDIVITVVMVLATQFDQSWARWVILIYTPLMVLLKIAAFVVKPSKSKLKPKTVAVPDAVYHILYGINLVLAALDRWWLIAIGWAVIWGLSVLTYRQSKSAKSK